MKKFLFTCFLAPLCLYGSTSFLSLVAQSPGADLLQRSDSPHRGGAILPDSFFENSGDAEVSMLPLHGSSLSTVDGGPILWSLENETASLRASARSDAQLHQSLVPSEVEASDTCAEPGRIIGHPTILPPPVLSEELESRSSLPPVLKFQKASFSQLRQEGTSAVGLGDSSFVILYGELINPDSLTPLQVSWKEHLLPGDMALKDSSFQVQLQHGTFFDGVLDPRAQKFLVKLPIQSSLGRLSLDLGNRSLVKDFLVFPGDSIKLGIDLQENTLVFGGPEKDWFEAQYAVFRAQKTNQFDSPRTLLEVNREAFLDQQDYRRQLETQDSVFGARVGIYELGKDGLDREYRALFPKLPNGIPGLSEALSYSDRLDAHRLDVLSSWIEASYFRNHLNTLRKYNYAMILAMGDTATAQRAKALFPEILELTKEKISQQEKRDWCTPCMDLALEWALINRSLNGTSLEDGLTQVLPPMLSDQVLLSRGIKDLRSKGLSFEEIAAIEKSLQEEGTQQTWRKLTAAFKAGGTLPDTDFITLEGTRTRLSDLIDRPTLLFFYFSTCTHSSNYFKNYLKPFFETYHQALGFQVVAISVDIDKGLWRSQLAEYALPEWTSLNLEPSEREAWSSRYQIQSFPRTILIDSSGGIRAFTIGGQDFEGYSKYMLSLIQSAQEPISIN